MKHQHIKLFDSIWNRITYTSFVSGLELTTVEWIKPFFSDMALPANLRDNQGKWIQGYQVFKNELEESIGRIPSPQNETQLLIDSFEIILNYIANEISVGSSLAFSNWFKRHFLSHEFQRSMDNWRLILQYTLFPCQRHSIIPSPPSELLTIFPLIEPFVWSNIEASRLELLKIPKSTSMTFKQSCIEEELYGSSSQELFSENNEFLHGNAWNVYSIIAKECTRKALMSIDRLMDPSSKKVLLQWFVRHQNHLLEYYGSDIDTLDSSIRIAHSLRRG